MLRSQYARGQRIAESSGRSLHAVALRGHCSSSNSGLALDRSRVSRCVYSTRWPTGLSSAQSTGASNRALTVGSGQTLYTSSRNVRQDWRHRCPITLRAQVYGRDIRFYSSVKAAATGDDSTLSNEPADAANVSAVSSDAGLERRMNQLGIQMLTSELWEQLFGREAHKKELNLEEEEVLAIAREHLQQQGIWGKPAEPVADTPFTLPPLVGNSIDEHFYSIGNGLAQPYLGMAVRHMSLELPSRPKTWEFKHGWLRYTSDGEITPVPYPEEDCITFDVETMPKYGNHAIMACAATEKAWYTWISPWLTGHSQGIEHLIPFSDGTSEALAKERIIVGHNVGYDRARIKDEYRLQGTAIGFLDTMSLHVAVSGLCSRQRAGWIKFSKAHDQQDLDYIRQNHTMMRYFDVSSVNSLREVARFHCDIVVNKEVRNIFMEGTPEEVRKEFNTLMAYCATDVYATHHVFAAVLPKFLKKCPHPVAFVGMMKMGSSFLTVDEHWPKYLAHSEAVYQQQSSRVEEKLRELAKAALEEKDPQHDPWLRQLDWKIEELKMTKAKFLKSGKYAKNGEPRPVARQFMVGYPKWYRDLCDRKTLIPKLTTRARIAPLLLKLKWNSFPVYYSQLYGWTFRVPRDADFTTKLKPLRFPPKPIEGETVKVNMAEGDMAEEEEDFMLLDEEDAEPDALADAEYEPIPDQDSDGIYYRIPHKDGEEARCGNPLAKNYIGALEDGILASEYPLAREALKMNISCSYWISARERVRSQFVIWDKHSNVKQVEEAAQQSAIALVSELASAEKGASTASKDTALEDAPVETKEETATEAPVEMKASTSKDVATKPDGKEPKDVVESDKVDLGLDYRGQGTLNGMILPQIATMGTITRRAVEATWMTASNAKKNRIGSELKAVVRAPPGYCIIGADVDSEELWISSLIGDAQFNAHGATAFGWMTLQGTKSAGTDMHSKTANILGINRDQAKIFNYGRIYGAGIKFAVQLLMQFNPAMDETTATQRAAELYAATKGTKWHRERPFDGGFWYGGSESYVFNALEGIATSGSPRTPVLGCSVTDALTPQYTDRQFMTSRVNWVVQSSGVDYLHLLITSMAYLIRKYDIDARFMLSVHDEIRYLVAAKDKYRATLALQISNLWTRAIFSYKLGINDLPQSVAFFSCVDIDHVLRKEVDMDCVTPSNPTPIAKGEKLTMEELLELTHGSMHDDPDFQPYPDPPVVTARTYQVPLDSQLYTPDAPSSEVPRRSVDRKLFLRAQRCDSTSTLRQLMADADLMVKENGDRFDRGNRNSSSDASRTQYTRAFTRTEPSQDAKAQHAKHFPRSTSSHRAAPSFSRASRTHDDSEIKTLADYLPPKTSKFKKRAKTTDGLEQLLKRVPDV